MKTLILSLVIFSFVGCSIIAPPKFNQVEYQTVAQMSAIVELGTCDKVTTDKLLSLAVFLKHYTKYLPNNTNAYDSSVLIYEQVATLDKLVTEKQLTETFCKRKLQILETSLDVMQHGSGGKLQ